MEDYNTRILNAKQLINNADYILVGAGAGLSTAAGLEYGGHSFEKNFQKFIEKYNFQDLYTATFYDFNTQEEKWAFWANVIKTNRFNKNPLPLYLELYNLLKEKEHFIITTNVDGQFEKAGFGKEKIFAVQGDYAYLQCENACHSKLYYNEKIVKRWLNNQKNCKIPSELVPKCPVCNGNMEVNLRKDAYFVQDKNWYEQNKKYEEFITKIKDKKVVLLEIGVGFNTPAIIRFPFEQMTYNNEKSNLIRINKDFPSSMESIKNRTISFNEDTNKIIKCLK